MLFITIFSATIVLIALILVTKSVVNQVLIFKKVKQLPGPPTTSLIWGNVKPLIDTPENFFKAVRKWGREYYPIYCNWTAHISVVNVLNPYDFETILINIKHNSKGRVYDMLHNWLGTGLLTSSDSKWQTRRKILTPSFHFNILQDFIKVFNEETRNLVQLLKKECHKPHISVTEFISDFTLNTIGETAMGINLDKETTNGREYKDAVHSFGKILVYRMCRPWLINDYLYTLFPLYFQEKKLVKILHNFTGDVIQKREKSFRASYYSRRKRLAMLDLLIAAKIQEKSIDDEGIREEVDTFMFEGHDTTSLALCYTLMMLACNRDVQDRIFEEIQEVLSGDTKPDYQTLQELRYTERCIKEVLRMYPSVPFMARTLGEDITTYSGHHLKAGTMVHLHVYDVHHNPDIYPDPEKFDPDRFLPENCQKRHTFAYVPFSAGPRNCIGQRFAMLEIKAALCGILSAFILEPLDTPDTIVLVADIVLRTKDSIKVKFVPRN